VLRELLDDALSSCDANFHPLYSAAESVHSTSFNTDPTLDHSTKNIHTSLDDANPIILKSNAVCERPLVCADESVIKEPLSNIKTLEDFKLMNEYDTKQMTEKKGEDYFLWLYQLLRSRVLLELTVDGWEVVFYQIELFIKYCVYFIFWTILYTVLLYFSVHFICG